MLFLTRYFFDPKCTFQILGGVRVGGEGWGDNSIEFINTGRMGDKSFKEWQRKVGGWKGG